MPRLRSVTARLSRIDPFDLATAILFVALGVFVVLTFRQYSVSNDEEVQHHYAELILRYYRSGFTDDAVFHFRDLFLYGGLFDLAAVGLQNLLPFDPYAMRHLLCALIGVGGIAATWATARMIAGSSAGFIAAVLLVTCGSYFGTLFNHTKDIPFAAGMMAATYVLLRIARDLASDKRRPGWGHVAVFGLLCGATLGIRVTGLLLVGYAGIVILMQTPLMQQWWPSRRRVALNVPADARFALRALATLVPAFVLAYVIMIAAWPWAALEPFNPLRGITDFADFHYRIRTLLAGQEYYMATVPSWYVPDYFLVKLPIPLMLGALLGVAFAARPRLFGSSPRLPGTADAQAAAQTRREIGFVAFTAVFPLVCQVVGHGPAFTGLRHFTFLILPLAALGGIGFTALLTALAARQRIVATLAASVLTAGVIADATTLARLHPYEYLYFNALAGGLAGAAGRYDTDYWANMMNEGVDQLEAYLNRTEGKGGKSERYTVAICSEAKAFETEARKDPRLSLTLDWSHADFFISSTHMRCDRELNGNVVATVARLGVPIGIVKDRRTITRPDIARMLPQDTTGGNSGDINKRIR